MLGAWRGERGNWCPGYQRDAHRAADLTVDHVVPLAAGGAPFDIANTVAGSEIVGVRLTQAAYAHGFALALPEKVEMARPTGVGRGIATYTIPIEGRDEWVAAAKRLA